MKYNKYSNKKTKVDDYTFDSKKEAMRYTQLRNLQRGGLISKLTLQPEYILQNSFKHDNKTHRAVKYIADFRYEKNGKVIVEDVKGFLTDVYKLKKKLFLFKYQDIDFREL